MTLLEKTIRRSTTAHRHEKSKRRRLILSLEPPAKVGARLEGTRQTYRLTAEELYELAVLAHERRIEKEAKRLVKVEGLTLKRARAKARIQCKEFLK